ncbi:2,3-diaminopropionate biosynthesis protein SbnA [Candidatus Protochlamydia sp. W-9]|uniref:2,3-diaminopropionate biosynthesis protein SbnA n=1 Tax=Candidatus Protochlamydia sp. W-9 TaxID=1785087 RepID=UPI0009ADF2D9|nr:2,3-diaminopropionate biosynthesis protein SbnA [Candidatus Protochlamydia sp. W-9]
MIIKSISEIASPPIFYKFSNFIPHSEVYIKLEGLNIAGSIKLTTARGLIETLEQAGKIQPNTKIIESSSGNLGVALSILCKEKGYSFTCVTDPNILPENEKLIKIYGATLTKITEKDGNGGYLASRIKYIEQLLKNDSNYIWLNQYANQFNPYAHYSRTAEDIFKTIPEIDYLFIGAGTTGTLMGCASFFKEYAPQTKIIAVDTVGSVTFGFPSKKRFIPGIGTSRRPEIVNEHLIDEILMIEERDAVIMCRIMLNKHGLFLGGSSGTVLQGIQVYQNRIPSGSKIVGISPDFGQKYLNMIYNDNWIQENFGLNFTDITS